MASDSPDVLRRIEKFRNELELKTVKKDGSHGWMWVIGETVINESGETVGLWGAAQDITERKKLHEIIAEAHAATLENERNLNEAQDIGNVGSYVYDLLADHWVSSVKQDDIFGIGENFDRSSIGWGLILHPDDQEEMTKYLFDYVVGNRNEFNKEYRIIRLSDGETRWVHGRGKLAFSKEGKPVTMIGTIQDITDRKETEYELANMSHEIRTPLNGIIGFTELLMEPDLDQEDQIKYLSVIEHSGERLLELINNLVDLSKIEAGQISLKLTQVNVNQLIESQLVMFKPEVAKKGLSLNSEVPEKLPFLNTDRSFLEAIMVNLIKNAIKFTEEGSVTVGCAVKPARLQFYVRDTGPGLPREKSEIIFERFHREEQLSKTKIEGAGLGLAISKSYVAALGGEIWVEAEIGVGSTFFFTIPDATQPGITNESISDFL